MQGKGTLVSYRSPINDYKVVIVFVNFRYSIAVIKMYQINRAIFTRLMSRNRFRVFGAIGTGERVCLELNFKRKLFNFACFCRIFL